LARRPSSKVRSVFTPHSRPLVCHAHLSRTEPASASSAHSGRGGRLTSFHLPKQLVMTLLALALCSSVAAQTAPDSQGFVGVKAGMNHGEAGDAFAGTVGVGGLVCGIRFGRDWALEVELWVPSSIGDSAD